MLTLQQVLVYQEKLQELAKKFHVQELYYLQLEETTPLRFMADLHLLVVPEESAMSSLDFYGLSIELQNLLDNRVFVSTEDNLKTLLNQKKLSQEEYNLALKKNSNILTCFSSATLDEMLGEQEQYTEVKAVLKELHKSYQNGKLQPELRAEADQVLLKMADLMHEILKRATGYELQQGQQEERQTPIFGR